MQLLAHIAPTFALMVYVISVHHFAASVKAVYSLLFWAVCCSGDVHYRSDLLHSAKVLGRCGKSDVSSESFQIEVWCFNQSYGDSVG